VVDGAEDGEHVVGGVDERDRGAGASSSHETMRLSSSSSGCGGASSRPVAWSAARRTGSDNRAPEPRALSA
jgi:hypothetical protein